MGLHEFFLSHFRARVEFDIQLVPVINPRLLYYINKWIPLDGVYMFDRPSLRKATVNSRLFNLAIMLVSEESLISNTLKNIPNYSDEKITAFEIAEMFDNLRCVLILFLIHNDIYKILTNIKISVIFKNFRDHELHKNLIKSKEPDLNITIDWLVRHIVFDDNDASSVDFYDVFAGHRPGDPKTFAENFLKTDFFKGYYLSHKNFLNERWCFKCGTEFKNQFVEVFLMAALYRNSKGRIDPYCNGGQEQVKNFINSNFALCC